MSDQQQQQPGQNPRRQQQPPPGFAGGNRNQVQGFNYQQQQQPQQQQPMSGQNFGGYQQQQQPVDYNSLDESMRQLNLQQQQQQQQSQRSFRPPASQQAQFRPSPLAIPGQMMQGQPKSSLDTYSFLWSGPANTAIHQSGSHSQPSSAHPNAYGMGGFDAPVFRPQQQQQQQYYGDMTGAAASGSYGRPPSMPQQYGFPPAQQPQQQALPQQMWGNQPAASTGSFAPQAAPIGSRSKGGYGLFSGGLMVNVAPGQAGQTSRSAIGTPLTASATPWTPMSSSTGTATSSQAGVPSQPMAAKPKSSISSSSAVGSTGVSGAVVPARPQHGQQGRQIQVRANFFPLQHFPGMQVYHYDLKITPEVPPSLNRKLFQECLSKFGKSRFKNVGMVYDGRRHVYSAKSLGFEELELDVMLTNEIQPITESTSGSDRKFTFKWKFNANVNLGSVKPFLDGTDTNPPVEALQALDIILRHRPSLELTTVGRSFFTRNDCKILGDGAECWMGYHQSLRPASGKLLINIDISATAFYEPGPVLNFLARNLGKRSSGDLKMPMKTREVEKCERLLKGVKVQVTHRGEMRRKYKIQGLTRTAADSTYFNFTMAGQDGKEVTKEISVDDYFRRQYNFTLQFPHLPCLRVGNGTRPVYLPMECCDIVQGQRFLRKLNEQQTAQMIRLTCQTPDRRANKIAQSIPELSLPLHGDDQTRDGYDQFQMTMNNEMMVVPARVLQPPTIQYHPTSREPLLTPKEGSWNLRDKKVVQPATLHSWAVICFGSPREMPQQKIDMFLRELIGTCRDTGLIITNPHPPAIYGDPHSNIEQTLQNAWQAAGESVQSFPQLILCILPNTGVPLYAEIKRVGDTQLGVPTQCLQVKHTFQPKKQYCANVCLKINAKLGGVNSFIVRNPSVAGDRGLPWVAEMPTMIFGADMTHPAHGEQRTVGSLCSLVGSLDRLASRYTATVRVQPPKKEVMRDLTTMVQELLKIFYMENNQTAPQRILFYRDGLSESQAHEVVKLELKMIREACEQLQSGYMPTITYIVVQKRHHARLFAVNAADADRSGNIPAGTVIDSHITHPNEFDFYLCSHAGLQGTSRPTHYHVLHDENNFNADSLHELTYRLCYGYARCTRSVSVVPPAYYADLVAFRAKYHMKSGGQGVSQQQSQGSALEREDVISETETVETGVSASTGKKKKRANTVTGTAAPGALNAPLTEEEEEEWMSIWQQRLALVKPELQKVMYFM